MKRGALILTLLAAACSSKPQSSFEVVLLAPERGGALAPAPAGFAVEPASKEDRQTADWAELRFLAARAAVKGAPGAAFAPVPTPAGMSLRDFPEEEQAFNRLSREWRLARPIFEQGAPASAPISTGPGLVSRAWTLNGRRYVLLVNLEPNPAAISPDALAPWRALFEARSDPRELLAPCGTLQCLAPHGVLWLEGRLLEASAGDGR